MASSMEERNDKKAWKAYMEDGAKVMDEAMRRKKAILEKYKDVKSPGMDGSPWEKEGHEVTKWVTSEFRRLREKHGIR